MIKKLSASAVILGLALLAGCSGSSTTPPVPTPPSDTWAVSVSASSGEIYTNQAAAIVATVTKNGKEAPDGTTVTFQASGGAFAGSGGTEAVVATTGGKATAYFAAPEAGTYAISVRVFTISASLSVKVKYPDTPGDLEIFSIVPRQGTLEGGEQVTLNGKGIVTPVEVFFIVEGVTYEGRFVSVEPDGSSVTVVTPEITGVNDTSKAYPADVRVDVGVGTGSQDSVTVAQGFDFLPSVTAPVIYQVYPGSGSARGGEQVTIFGQNFVEPLSVEFTGSDFTLPAQVLSVSSDGRQITVITPQISVVPIEQDRMATVKVYSGGFTAELGNAFIFTADILTPSITVVSPNFGPIEGGTQVTIFGEHAAGAGFQSPVQVVFSGGNITAHEAQVISVSQYEIIAISPDITQDIAAGGLTPPITVDVTVTNVDSGKSDTAPGAFIYGEGLSITGNSPIEGPMTQETLVTIYGSGFRSPLWVDYLFGSPPLRLDVVSVGGSELVVRMPPQPPNCGNISAAFKVTLVESGLIKEGGQFTYIGNTPMIISINPPTVTPSDADNLPINTTFTISGQGFEPEMQVEVNGYALPAANVVVNTANQTITLVDVWSVMAPNNIGLIYDTVPCDGGNRDVATSVPVTVTNLVSGCSDTLDPGITYQPWDTACN